MRRRVKIMLGILFACGPVFADPPTCASGTLADYIALGAQGCILNGDAFANFRYTASADGGGTTITADQILVTPFVVVPAAARFNFSAPWSVDQNQTQQSVIRYTMVPPPGGPTPSQLQLVLGTAVVRGIFGSVTVNESTNVGKLGVSTRCTEVCQLKANDSLDFGPVSVVLVRVRVSLLGGNGGALLTDFAAALNRCPVCV